MKSIKKVYSSRNQFKIIESSESQKPRLGMREDDSKKT